MGHMGQHVSPVKKFWELQKRIYTVQAKWIYNAKPMVKALKTTTDTFSYTVPLTYTKFGERAFSVAGPSVWNSLPADIRHITDISIFKRHLKTHLFNLYFNT